MRYRTTAAFDRDIVRPPPEHRQLFVRELRDHFLPAVDAGGISGSPNWPRRLRIHRLAGSPVYSLTWNFSSPDGRATFHLDGSGDEPVLVWHRIGDHGIHREP
ncbi:MAG: hypothetical protein ACT4RN_13840 [Pseudonocardia sp.]